MTGERIPDDIQEEARRVVERGYDEGLVEAVERALLAERERAARIAEDWQPEEEYLPGDHYEAGLCDAGERIAAAIRA